MRIVYCIAATCNSGGMERMLSLKANELAQRGNEVFIITTDQRGQEPYFRFHPSIRHIDTGINYEENNGSSLINKISNYPVKQWRHFRILRKILKEISPDVTVSMFCNEASLIPYIKTKGAKILEIHFSRYKRLQYGRKGLWRVIDNIRNYTDRFTAKKYDRFVVLTNEDSALWGNIKGLRVIPNFCADSEKNVLADMSAKRIIAVGRICHQKGFDRLAEIWAKISKELPDWKITIYGGGDKTDIQSLIKTVENLGIKDSFEIKSPVKNITDEYLKSSILVMTSRYEGLPMVLIEAQTAGLPTVSYNCKCGPTDVIENGKNGFLIEDGDADNFAKALLKLASDQDLRCGMQRHAIAKSKSYDKKSVMDKWEKLFTEICR